MIMQHGTQQRINIDGESSTSNMQHVGGVPSGYSRGMHRNQGHWEMLEGPRQQKPEPVHGAVLNCKQI